jgi:hypothetical protein
MITSRGTHTYSSGPHMGPTIEWDPCMSKWVGPTHV